MLVAYRYPGNFSPPIRNENPVKGTTGADGSLDFRYDPYQGSKLLLQDVDGVANGGEFADQNISFDTASSSVFVDLQLKP